MKKFLYSVFMLAAVVLAACSNDDNGDIQPKTIIEDAPFCDFDWSNISPAIFGSLFQCVSDKTKRRTLGEHYTSEENIFKVIKPLFLDSLWDEFNKTTKSNVDRFLEKLSNIRILDPACGSVCCSGDHAGDGSGRLHH